MNVLRKALDQLVTALADSYDIDDAEVVKAQAYAQAVLDLTPKEQN